MPIYRKILQRTANRVGDQQNKSEKTTGDHPHYRQHRATAFAGMLRLNRVTASSI